MPLPPRLLIYFFRDMSILLLLMHDSVSYIPHYRRAPIHNAGLQTCFRLAPSKTQGKALVRRICLIFLPPQKLAKCAANLHALYSCDRHQLQSSDSLYSALPRYSTRATCLSTLHFKRHRDNALARLPTKCKAWVFRFRKIFQLASFRCQP